MHAITKSRPEAYTAWPKGLEYAERRQPEMRSAGDVLIRVVAGGICGTDVGIYQSKDSLGADRDAMFCLSESLDW